MAREGAFTHVVIVEGERGPAGRGALRIIFEPSFDSRAIAFPPGRGTPSRKGSAAAGRDAAGGETGRLGGGEMRQKASEAYDAPLVDA